MNIDNLLNEFVRIVEDEIYKKFNINYNFEITETKIEQSSFISIDIVVKDKNKSNNSNIDDKFIDLVSFNIFKEYKKIISMIMINELREIDFGKVIKIEKEISNQIENIIFNNK